MKTTIVIVALVASALNLKAQDKTQGKISYEHIINLHASLTPEQLQYKDMVPELSTAKEYLYFNGKLTKTERQEVDSLDGDQGASVKIKMTGAPTVCYSDGTSQGTYFLTEKEGKKILMRPKTMKEELIKSGQMKSKEKVGEVTEKIGNRKKNIMGFECTEVIYGELTLWVTSLLPFKSGPTGLVSKHGAILGMEDGDRIKYFATAIDYAPVKTVDVTRPLGLEIK